MKTRSVLTTGVLALCALVFVPLAAQSPRPRTFTPVTDAMLRNPSPDDWLHWRRTLDGWGYSPLNQINRQNVGQLQLAWSWALHPGSNQATPLVHDGIMYVPNPNSIVQALDAATGDLIWEYRREFPPGRSGSDGRTAAKSRHLGGQGLSQYRRCPHRRVECTNGRSGVGCDGRRP